MSAVSHTVTVIPPFQFFIADILISAAQFPYLIFRQSKLLLKGAVIHEIVFPEYIQFRPAGIFGNRKHTRHICQIYIRFVFQQGLQKLHKMNLIFTGDIVFIKNGIPLIKNKNKRVACGLQHFTDSGKLSSCQCRIGFKQIFLQFSDNAFYINTILIAKIGHAAEINMYHIILIDMAFKVL